MSSATTQSDAPAALGAVVRSADGRRIAAVGVCANPATAETAEAACAAATDRAKGSRLFPVEAGGHRYVGLCLEDGAHELILLRRADTHAVLFDFLGTVPFASAILDHFLSDPYQAITVADREGRMRFISPVHEDSWDWAPAKASAALPPRSSRIHGCRRSSPAARPRSGSSSR